MFKIKFIISLSIFVIFLLTTSAVKNKTRIIEKQILNLNKIILVQEKNINEAELDFYYLTSPIELEKKIKEPMDNFSAYRAAKEVTIPVLVIHDKEDEDVPVKAAYHIRENLKDGELVITEGLGHRKILGDTKVIKKIIEFLN